MDVDRPIKNRSNMTSRTYLPEEQAVDDYNHEGETASATGSLPEFKPDYRLWLAFIALAVLTWIVALDGTSISVALPVIAEQLSGSALEAFWSGTSFLLCSTVLQPSFASLSNVFGRKPMILVALLTFLVGTIVAGVSKSFKAMLAGRSIQGIGGGGIIAISEIIVTDLVPLRFRGNYYGLLNCMWSIGSVTGPIIGGAFAQPHLWRWIFYINFPFTAMGLATVIAFIHLNFPVSSLAKKLAKIDVLGTTLFIGSTLAFLMPLTWGGVLYPWSSWKTILPLILGVVGFVVFALVEIYFASNPIIPPVLFQNRTAIVTFICQVIQAGILWCILYYIPLYFEAVKGFSPLLAGVSLLPATFTTAPSAILAGAMVTKLGHYRWATWSGWALGTLGTGLLCLLDVDTSIVGWVFLILPVGIGLGMLFPAMSFAIQASSSNENMALAVAMENFFRAAGQAFGVAIGGVIFQNQMHKYLSQHPALTYMADEASKDAARLVEIIRHMEDGTDKLHLRMAYVKSLRVVFAVFCAIAGVGGLLSILTRAYDLDRELVTEQGMRDRNTRPDQGETGGSQLADIVEK